MSAPRGLPLDWYPIWAISAPATTTSYPFFGRGGRLYGWAFQETTGAAPATFELFDGTGSGGQSILPATLTVNQSFRDIWGKPGIEIRTGLFMNVTAGSVRGSVYVLGLSVDEILRLNNIEAPA